MFKAKVKILNPGDPKRFFEEDFSVDTGALYSLVPEDRLQAIGVEPLHSIDLVPADGRRDRRLFGEALFTLQQLNETFTCPVVFGPKDSLYLLATTALENFGVEADPANQKLKPVVAIIGGFRASRSMKM